MVLAVIIIRMSEKSFCLVLLLIVILLLLERILDSNDRVETKSFLMLMLFEEGQC